MSLAQYDVVVVGAGCAGLTAAIGLARAGFAVVVVEAGSNGVGGVCSAENLAQPDILGVEAVESLPWERRLIERGNFATDGRRFAGTTYRDPDAFRHCYLVSSSAFHVSLARITVEYGVALRMETTVESLIREGRRVVGVATTRGPLYGDLVFVAEGDAGHLVSREGLDRSRDSRDAPAFLYRLQQIVELPPGVIEERFRVGPDEGVAHDLLLRNPRGKPLNARGLLCTNRQSVTLSVVLAAEHLAQHFDGEPLELLDWFADMPALRPWWREGRRGAWTANLIRAGGLRDVPYLVDDGLAVGGAAAGLGVVFPALNLSGPATASALLLSRAAVRIRAEGGAFDRESLLRHYVEPVRQTHYWKDMEFLQRWPDYVKKTQVLFDEEFDLLLDSSAVWANRRQWLPRKFLAWLGVLSRVRWSLWSELRDDLFHVAHALRFRDVTPRPALARVVLDGALNAFRDLVRQPRPHLPPAGKLRVHYHSADDDAAATAMPAPLRRWFARFRPVLSSAGRLLYRNDDTPLSVKMTETVELLVRQINLLDIAFVVVFGFVTALASAALAVLGYPFRRLASGGRKPPVVLASGGRKPPVVLASGERKPPVDTPVDTPTEGFRPPLANPTDSSRPTPLIRIVWKSTQPRQRAEAVQALPHICPAGVFEVRGGPPETVRVTVHAEKCIQCEVCWRTNPFVDWGSGTTTHPFEMPNIAFVASSGRPPNVAALRLLDKLERKLIEFDAALASEPATVDRHRADHLEMLARYAQQLAARFEEVYQESAAWEGRQLAEELVEMTVQRTRRTWEGRFAWAGADGRLLRQHHVAILRRCLDGDGFDSAASPAQKTLPVPKAEDAADKHLLADTAARRYLLDALDGFDAETPERIELLAALANEVRDDLAAWDESRAADRRSVDNSYRLSSLSSIVDVKHLRALLDISGDWSTLAQRRALLAELEELRRAEERLAALADDWADGPLEQTDLSGGFARQAAHILAGKRMLLTTHARLEDGIDAELAMVLLRVWLDHAANLLDEFTLVVRDVLNPPATIGDRPLVEPGSGPPLTTRAQYLTAPAPYVSGDFLLAPIDLLQPRLTPEMVGGDEGATVSDPLDYPIEALLVEMTGRREHAHTRSFELEAACARLIAADVRERGGGLHERCVILEALAGEVMPRWQRGGVDAGVRHLGRDVLELEALKADFRLRLQAVHQVFGEALGRNADVKASCFALAEATAWLKAADSVLGRMAWLSRLAQAEDKDEPLAMQQLGVRALAHCHAEVRDRLHRFDEDLASLRRGYFAPHVRAAALLTFAPVGRP